jgi:hypothetical protein
MSDVYTSSYERINYSLRPGKGIERRMLCDLFARLYPFYPVHTYRYVGFGSIYFSDFQMVHRNLGVNDLLSIEHDVDNSSRFELNRPYSCISLDFRASEVALPSLDWSRNSICWLDYDGAISTSILADLVTTAKNAISGSFLAVSFNAHQIASPTHDKCAEITRRTGRSFEIPEYRKMKLEEQIPGKIGLSVTGSMLNRRGLPKVLHGVVISEIAAALNLRNQELPNDEKIHFKQIVNIVYQDGAQMLTVGGVFVSNGDGGKFDECKFDDLPFVRTGSDSFEIRVPCLTQREMHKLDSLLPVEDPSTWTMDPLPNEDVRKYAEVYRYFPRYSEMVFS